MRHTYSVTGMTCEGCVASVTEKLSQVEGVRHVEVDLKKGVYYLFIDIEWQCPALA